MAAPTMTAIRTRIGDICATYPGMGTIITNDHDPITALPAVRVYAEGATYQRNRSTDFIIRRIYTVYVMVKEIEKPTDDAEALDAYDDCEPLLTALLAFLYQHQRLRLNDSGLVVDTGDPEDGGIGQVGHHKKVYAGFRIAIPVLTRS